jgi:hypothetical protein
MYKTPSDDKNDRLINIGINDDHYQVKTAFTVLPDSTSSNARWNSSTLYEVVTLSRGNLPSEYSFISNGAIYTTVSVDLTTVT